MKCKKCNKTIDLQFTNVWAEKRRFSCCDNTLVINTPKPISLHTSNNGLLNKIGLLFAEDYQVVCNSLVKRGFKK